jgi:hypothetical protein
MSRLSLSQHNNSGFLQKGFFEAVRSQKPCPFLQKRAFARVTSFPVIFFSSMESDRTDKKPRGRGTETVDEEVTKRYTGQGSIFSRLSDEAAEGPIECMCDIPSQQIL